MKDSNFNLASFLAGACVTTWVCIIIFFAMGGSFSKGDVSSSTASTSAKEESSETETKNYNTKELKKTITVDGKKITFYAPKEYYSLTDQYLENMGAYYGNTDVKSDNFYVVGNNQVASSATTLINANTRSDVKELMKQLYPDFNEDEMSEAPAYEYMTKGKIPENAPDNFEIEELGTFKVDGVTYKVYHNSYDTTYEVGDSPESASDDFKSEGEDKDKEKTEKPKTEVVHTDEVCAYSDTKDPIEILVYQEVFDKDKALELVKGFVGAK